MQSFQRLFSECLLSTAFLTIATNVTEVRGEDWPQWRGLGREGICAETGLLKQWPSSGPRLVWKANGLGTGFATVSVVGDRIFTTGQSSEASSVVAINAGNGKLIWSAKLGRSSSPGGYAGPRSEPGVVDGSVYALGQSGELICVDTATGNEKWRKEYVKDFGGTEPQWGFSEAPLLDGDKIIITPGGRDGTLVALDRKTGAVLWRSKDWTDLAHYSSPIGAEIGGVRQYIQLTAASVAGVGATDGKLLWRTPRRGQTAVIPTPICRDGFVYVTSGYGVGCNLFKIAAKDGKFVATEVYANKVMVNHHGGVIPVGDFVYGYSDGKGWTCQDFKSGEARWQEKDKLGKGALLYAEGNLYLREQDKGTVALIEADPKGYKEHGRFEQPSRSSEHAWPHPVISGGRLYLRDQDVLLCYDIKER